MDVTRDGAALADCVRALDDQGRRAVRRHWEQVIREEWVPPERCRPRRVRLAEEARRAVARIAAASRVPGAAVAA